MLLGKRERFVLSLVNKRLWSFYYLKENKYDPIEIIKEINNENLLRMVIDNS